MADHDDTASDIMHDGVLALQATAELLSRVDKKEGLVNIDPATLGALLRLIHEPILRGMEKSERDSDQLFNYRQAEVAGTLGRAS